MLEKHSLTYEMSCDFCNEQMDTEEDDFRLALDNAKADGWKIFKEDGEWYHKCPDCVAPKEVAMFSRVNS